MIASFGRSNSITKEFVKFRSAKVTRFRRGVGESYNYIGVAFVSGFVCSSAPKSITKHVEEIFLAYSINAAKTIIRQLLNTSS